MSIFKIFGAETNTVVIDKSTYSTYADNNRRGSVNVKVSSITVVNNNPANNVTVDLLIVNNADTSVKYYIAKSVIIPVGVSLLLDNPFSFNADTHSLKITSTGTGANISLIIN